MQTCLRTLHDDDYGALARLGAVLDAEARIRALAGHGRRPGSGWLTRLVHPARLTGVAMVAGEGGDTVLGVARLLGAGAGRVELLAAVHPEFRGAGLGTALVEAALELADDRGHAIVAAAFGRHDPAVVSLCARLGLDVVPVAPEEVEVLVRRPRLRQRA
jgi:GNAT superfamily N-acetyltransferase